MVIGFILLGVFYVIVILPLYILAFGLLGKISGIDWKETFKQEVADNIKRFLEKLKAEQKDKVLGIENQETIRDYDEEI